MDSESILWRRMDPAGYDSCIVLRVSRNWHVRGTAVFSEDQRPCRLNYEIVCDMEWRTISGLVDGWYGKRPITIELTAVPSLGWRMNGTFVPEVKDCLDLDLSFTPSTNLIPVRRMGLSVGGSSISRAAWLSFPGLRLEPLEQTYYRDGPSSYHYQTTDGFSTDLHVNDTGFITSYPGRWEVLALDP